MANFKVGDLIEIQTDSPWCAYNVSRGYRAVITRVDPGVAFYRDSNGAEMRIPSDGKDGRLILAKLVVTSMSQSEALAQFHAIYGKTELFSAKVCECGKDSHGFASHATWCQKSEYTK